MNEYPAAKMLSNSASLGDRQISISPGVLALLQSKLGLGLTTVAGAAAAPLMR
jgi:hypothetical protein